MRPLFWIVLLAGALARTAPAEEPKLFHLLLRAGEEIEFVWVPPGSFLMGAADGEGDEAPVRTVALRSGFWMSRCEITQSEYESVMSTNPSTFRGPNLPVDSVSYRDVQTFLAKLPQCSQLPAELQARLPTEAEWEYACRGGGTNAPAAARDAAALAAQAWFADNSGLSTHPVGQKPANVFGLHDLLGNVWEWCGDAYLERSYGLGGASEDPAGPQVGSTRVLRGGSWRNEASLCRPTNRFHYRMWSRDYTVGFRLVLVAK